MLKEELDGSNRNTLYQVYVIYDCIEIAKLEILRCFVDKLLNLLSKRNQCVFMMRPQSSDRDCSLKNNIIPFSVDSRFDFICIASSFSTSSLLVRLRLFLQFPHSLKSNLLLQFELLYWLISYQFISALICPCPFLSIKGLLKLICTN